MQLSATEYRLLVEQAPLMIWRCDTDKKCDYFNQVWLDFTGRPMAQELGDGWAEGVHPDDLAHCFDTFVGSFDRRQPFEIEYRLRRHDGHYRWIFDRGTPFADDHGLFQGYIGSCVDVSERREAQEALRKAAETEIRMLRGILPICAHCKRIRNDQGCWETVESYLRGRSEAEFSHTICPSCLDRFYPDSAFEPPAR